MSVDILRTNCDQCVSMVQCCFTSIATTKLIRTKEWRLDSGYRPKKTRETVLLRRCPLAIVRHCAIAVSTAVLGRVTRTMSVALLWGTTRSERSPTFAAQLHLPAHDLFWANLRVHFHLPPPDLAWSPVAWLQNSWTYTEVMAKLALCHSSGAVWESRWTSWAVRPNELSGFRGRKDLLNRASALVTACP